MKVLKKEKKKVSWMCFHQDSTIDNNQNMALK